MSVIIVGVGHANFSQMENLDSDKSLLRDFRGNSAVRDIVQFVAYREYFKSGQSKEEAAEKWTEDILKEVPGQLVQYMKMNKIEPNHIPHANED
jgi:hypothetical protein